MTVKSVGDPCVFGNCSPECPRSCDDVTRSVHDDEARQRR